MTRGVTPNREFVVQYKEVADYTYRETIFNTFQIILHESGDIQVKYLDVTSFGERKTGAGIENADGTAGLQYTPMSQSGRYRNRYVHYSYPSVNRAPEADAGDNQTVNVNDTVTLDGSESYDPDGDTIFYQWTQTDGPPVELSDSEVVKPTFTAPPMGLEGGTLTFLLVVTDEDRVPSEPDSVDVTVNPGSSSTIPGPGLYFPHVATVDGWETEICLINTDGNARLEGELKAYDDNGEETGSMQVDLSPNGRQEWIVGEKFEDPDEIGYIVFEASSDTSAGYVKYYIQGQCRAAVPAVSADDVNTGDIYITHIASGDGWYTGISLVNTTSSAKELVMEFDNGEETKQISLAPREHLAFTIQSRFGGDPQPDIHSAVIKNGGGVIGLAKLMRGNWLSAVLLKDDLATSIYYPHIPGDGGWVTGLVAYNPSDDSCSIDIIPYDASGKILTSKLDISVGGKDKYVGLVSSDRLFRSVDGVMESTPDLYFDDAAAWLAIESTCGITGLNLFTANTGYAGFSSVGMQSRGGIFPKLVDSAASSTGIAFVNIEDEEAQVGLTAYADSGVEVASVTVTMPGHGKEVRIAKAFFNDDISEAAYIRYSSNRELVGFQMNMDVSGAGVGPMLDGLPALRAEPVSVRAFIDAPENGVVFEKGVEISFSGRGYDAEGQALGDPMLWQHVYGEPWPFTWTSDINGEIGHLSSFSTAGLLMGTHTITLTVMDLSTKEEGTAKITIEITGSSDNHAPTVEITSPDQGSSYTVGDTINLGGSAADYEDGALTGDSLVWKYTINGGSPVNAGIGESPTPLDTVSAGTYVITLTATDSEGAEATDTVSVTVSEEAGTNPPEAYIDSIRNSAGGTTPFYAEEEIIFTGHGYDEVEGRIEGQGGMVYGFQWKIDGEPIGENNSSFTLSSGLEAGTYTVTLTVGVSGDAGRLVGTSEPFTIEVVAR